MFGIDHLPLRVIDYNSSLKRLDDFLLISPQLKNISIFYAGKFYFFTAL